MEYKCKKCGRPSSKSTIRRYKLGLRKPVMLCHACMVVKENNPNWKGGKPKCLDCRKQLQVHRHKRCKECWKKFYKGSNTYLWGKRGKDRYKKNTWSYDYVHNWLERILDQLIDVKILNVLKNLKYINGQK